MSEGQPTPALRWHRCRRVAGHGVASGRAAHSPYPAGTIALQAPLFAAHGIDLSPFFAGTLNLLAAGEWRLRTPDARVEQLRWTDRHPPETFSFWKARLRTEGGQELPALVYHPHPETKRSHHQPPGQLELLAPWIEGLAADAELELGLDPRRCRLIQPARLRARLLEFLKFRVLAAQEGFFTGISADAGAPAGAAPADLAPFRQWLAPLWPEALDLSDDDLRLTLEQARHLYVD